MAIYFMPIGDESAGQRFNKRSRAHHRGTDSLKASLRVHCRTPATSQAAFIEPNR